MKHKLCYFTFFISFLLFLHSFGTTCFLSGSLNEQNNTNQLTAPILLTVYFFILLIISLAAVHCIYNTTKPLLAGCIFSVLYPIITPIVSLTLWITNNIKGINDSWSYYAISLSGAVILCGMYLAALIIDKRENKTYHPEQ